MARKKDEEVIMSTTKCAKCRDFLEKDPKKVRVLFDEDGNAALYHHACAKKITGGKSTGRPALDKTLVQDKMIHIKLATGDKEYIKKVSKDSSVAMGALIKRAANRFMEAHPNPGDQRSKAKTWPSPATDASLIITVSEAEQGAFRDYADGLGVDQNVFLVQTTLDYFLEAVSSEGKNDKKRLGKKTK